MQRTVHSLQTLAAFSIHLLFVKLSAGRDISSTEKLVFDQILMARLCLVGVSSFR
jgi:hypothetical protein